MSRYYFVFSASGVLIDGHGSDPAIGFIAMREGRGRSQEEAERLAKIELLKQWKLAFNQNNKAGTPMLEIVHASRIRNPLKRVRVRDDFQFFSDNLQREAAIRQGVEAARKWLRIK